MKKLLAAFALSACVAAGAFPADATQSAQPGDGRPDITISEADRNLAIGNLITAVREQHFSVAEGARIARALQGYSRARRYAAITSGRQLAAKLTEDLRAISGDPHFLVDYFVRARPYPMQAAAATEAAQQRQDLSLVNYGVRSAERLDGNIGYLRIDRFAPAQDAGPVLQAAIAMLSATEALVIDLRYNGGGYGDTATFLAGLLLPEPARMSDVIARGGAVTQMWTPIGLSGRYGKPVYVLTSARTFSAAEAFAYNLRALGRIRIVGERTRGGANPITHVLLSPRFAAVVPIAFTRNPITGGNWQGGIAPDIESPADQALVAAQRDAARMLIGRHPDDPITRELRSLAGG